jgi:peptidyl-tRNA hydrolase, PTH1 family
MKLIVGLGNPGEKYAGNRHNIGFMAVDEIARGYTFGPWKKRFQGLATEGQIGTEKCILLKPTTFMNESGRSAGEAMRFYKLSPSDVIAIHDELDLKPGTVRVKTGGGNAGHNGLKSLSAYIGNDYRRVRLGIGHPGDRALVIHYVLQDFAKADREWLDPLLEGVARGMARLVEGGDAAFLSEAARGRPTAPAAAKLNGAAAPAAAKISAVAPKIEAVPPAMAEAAAMAAAAWRLENEPVLVPAIPVVAARGGSAGGAVSSAVMLPEPAPRVPVPEPPRPTPKSEAPRPAPAPQPQGPAPSPFYAEHQPRPEPAQEAGGQGAGAEPIAPARPAEKAAPAQEKKRGFFGWLFHKRIRGGSRL